MGKNRAFRWRGEHKMRTLAIRIKVKNRQNEVSSKKIHVIFLNWP